LGKSIIWYQSQLRGSSLHHRQAVSRAKEEGVLLGKSRHRQQGGDGHGAEAIAMMSSAFMSESSTRCGIDDNMKASHRQAASPVANMEGEPPARCGTGGEHAATSASPWRARGEGIGGASLFEASGDGGNRRDKMAMAAIYALHRPHQRPWASREKISNNKIREAIVGTNLVI
jgi:hypothetical protein